MNRIKEQVVAALFLLALAGGFGMFLLGLLPGGGRAEGIRRPAFTERREFRPKNLALDLPRGRVQTRTVKLDNQTVKNWIGKAEGSVNAILDESHTFIQIYGGVQRIAGRRVLEDMADPRYTVVKLDDGSLSFASNSVPDTGRYAQNLWRLGHVLELRETPLLYIQAPQKISPDGKGLPDGVTDTGNAAADELLRALARLDIDTLDLRDVLAEGEGDWSDWFFRTDHHWTPEAGFAAYQSLCDAIAGYTYTEENEDGEETELHYKIYPEYRDPARFKKTTYSDYFLGSQGKRVGSLYAGADDITIWEPDFLTWFTHSSTGFSPTREGPFAESLLFPERLGEADLFADNPYTIYSGGDFSIAHIDNHFNEQGPRIVLLRDSYACVVTPFLALACSRLTTIDLRYFKDNLMTYLDWLKPDLVFVMYTPGATSSDVLFDFFAGYDHRRADFPRGKADDNLPLTVTYKGKS